MSCLSSCEFSRHGELLVSALFSHTREHAHVNSDAGKHLKFDLNVSMQKVLYFFRHAGGLQHA